MIRQQNVGSRNASCLKKGRRGPDSQDSVWRWRFVRQQTKGTQWRSKAIWGKKMLGWAKEGVR